MSIQPYVEVTTFRKDGAIIILRMKGHMRVARDYAEDMFGRINVPTNVDWRRGLAPGFINDYGEGVLIEAVSYGDNAQVTEGTFFL